ncbi:MAG: hypothetical protein U1E65_06215 [Myxococcota bacterium]
MAPDRRLLILAVLGLWASLSACDGGRSVRVGPGGNGADRGVSSADGGAEADGGSGDDAAPPQDGGGPRADGGPEADGSIEDASARDADPSDAGSGQDAATGADRGLGQDAAGPPDLGPPDAGPPAGSVQLTVQGCSADFGGDIVVAYNGSLGIASLRGPSLAASLQFDLRGQTGTIPLSTRHRIDTGLVVNLVTFTTWTNISQDPNVITGGAPDPILGTLVVHAYQPESGIADIELRGVQLENVSDHSLCRLDGRATTTRLGR